MIALNRMSSALTDLIDSNPRGETHIFRSIRNILLRHDVPSEKIEAIYEEWKEKDWDLEELFEGLIGELLRHRQRSKA